MSCLVLLTNAWGSKHGGINAFNTDFAGALGLLLSPGTRVLCVVCDASPQERKDAGSHNVELVEVGNGPLDASRAPEVAAAVHEKTGGEPAAWWVGHDIVSGELATALPRVAGHGRSAVIHHMSYIDYQTYKHGVGATAEQKYRQQYEIFRRADRVFAVGPLLRDRLADMLARDPRDVAMIVPGLAEIEPAPMPRRFAAITFGRLDPTNDRIKQGRLAVAAFAAACKRAHDDPAAPKALRDSPRFSAIGIAEAGGEEERSLQALADEKAGRVIQLVALPYDEDRSRVFDDLRRSSTAMMLSWHEGFGLTGWEAIAAEVPLIVSRSSGLHQMVDELLAGAGTGCLHVIDVRGQAGNDEDENFRPEDEHDVANAIMKIANDQDRAKKNAKMLRALLLQSDPGCTWSDAARRFAAALEIPIPEDDLVPVAVAPQAPEPAAEALLEQRGPAWERDRGLSESQLLRAEEVSVPFHAARRHVLDEVLGWARGDAAPPASIQLRIGPGGTGKTRLMVEACEELGREGWRTGFVAGGRETEKKRWHKLFAGGTRTLVVIDYAEARRPEIAAVVDVALRFPHGSKARIMLLAREAGEWWEKLVEEHPALESFLTGLVLTGARSVGPNPRPRMTNGNCCPAALIRPGALQRAGTLGASPRPRSPDPGTSRDTSRRIRAPANPPPPPGRPPRYG